MASKHDHRTETASMWHSLNRKHGTLHKARIYSRASVQKPPYPWPMHRHITCFNEIKTWTPEQWKCVIWSHFSLFPAYGRIYVWRNPATHNVCGKGPQSRKVQWLLCEAALHLRNIRLFYSSRSALWCKCRCHMFPYYRTRCYILEHQDKVKWFPWPPQSADLNIIEPLWDALECKISSILPHNSTVREVEAFLLIDCFNIPVHTVLFG